MAVNERLRTAVTKAGLSVEQLAELAQVDPKTCERWITKGRAPHMTNARRAAIALREDMSHLWPTLEQGRRRRGMHPDLLTVYATRADAPIDIWRTLFQEATSEIAVLVYAANFLHELWPDFDDLLRAKAGAGCHVRIALGDPDSDAVIGRGREERYGLGIGSRCRQALLHYEPLLDVPGIEIHQHATTLYNSIYRGDDVMIVNTHAFGINAYANPILHLRRRADGGMFDRYASSVDKVWARSQPAKAGA